MTELMESELATRSDLKDFKNELQIELRTKLQEIRNDIVQLEYRLTIKLGTVATIVKFF